MSESLKSLKNYKKQLILGPIFKLTEAVFELIVPLLMAYIIDYGISLDSNNNVIALIGKIISQRHSENGGHRLQAARDADIRFARELRLIPGGGSVKAI